MTPPDIDMMTAWIAAPQPGLDQPEWARTALHAPRDTVFVPAAIGRGGELSVILCALQDGQPTVRHLGHAYVPAGWLRQQYPSAADVIDTIENRARAAAQAERIAAAQPGCQVEAPTP